METIVLSKAVWKLNFGQYGQMEKHSQEETRTGRKSEGRRCTLAKAAGAEVAGQTRDEKLHAIVARSTF